MTIHIRQPFNPVFWLMWLLPAAAVIASFTTLAIALQGADRALPSNYHWEGERLDADFARAQRAAELGIAATLVMGAGGECSVTLRPAKVGGDALELRLTHGVDAGLDRLLRLVPGQPETGSGQYHAPCAALAEGRWRIVLQDAAGSWALRGILERPAAKFELRARAPGGPGT